MCALHCDKMSSNRISNDRISNDRISNDRISNDTLSNDRMSNQLRVFCSQGTSTVVIEISIPTLLRLGLESKAVNHSFMIQPGRKMSSQKRLK